MHQRDLDNFAVIDKGLEHRKRLITAVQYVLRDAGYMPPEERTQTVLKWIGVLEEAIHD